MRALYVRFIKNNAGVTAIEYGLIAALVAVVCIAAGPCSATSLSTTFNDVAGSV